MTIKDFKDLNLDEIQPPDYLSTTEKEAILTAKNRLKEIKRVLDKAATIASIVDLPGSLRNSLQSIMDEFGELFLKISNDNEAATLDERSASFRQVGGSIASFYSSFFEISSGNTRLLALNSISTYGNESYNGADEKVSKLINNLGVEVNKAAQLNKEFESKATKIVISDYATIFGNQAEKNKKSSRIWLGISILISLSFFTTVFYAITNGWFRGTIYLQTIENNIVSKREVIDIPFLISKILILSFILYIISFGFRQYSIFKNLQVTNEHRRDIMNSFILFEASLGSNDPVTKNTMMIQLSKAIYEMTHTGFLSSKHSENSNSHFIELTKFITNGK